MSLPRFFEMTRHSDVSVPVVDAAKGWKIVVFENKSRYDGGHIITEFYPLVSMAKVSGMEMRGGAELEGADDRPGVLRLALRNAGEKAKVVGYVTQKEGSNG